MILQVSENPVRFHHHGNVLPISAAAAAVADVAAVPVAQHLDHVEDSDLLHAAAVAGFSSVMFDAARLPYDENIRATADAATWAHDQVSGLRPSWASWGQRRCTRTRRAHRPGRGRAARRPDRSRRSRGRSGQLARDDRTQAQLDHHLIAALCDAVLVPLVLHGSSGVADDELARAVSHGIVKVTSARS